MKSCFFFFFLVSGVHCNHKKVSVSALPGAWQVNFWFRNKIMAHIFAKQIAISPFSVPMSQLYQKMEKWWFFSPKMWHYFTAEPLTHQSGTADWYFFMIAMHSWDKNNNFPFCELISLFAFLERYHKCHLNYVCFHIPCCVVSYSSGQKGRGHSIFSEVVTYMAPYTPGSNPLLPT